MSKSSLVKKIREHFGLEVTPFKSEQEINEDTPILVPNRRNKRAARIRNTVSGTTGVHDALRAGTRASRRAKRTGQPEWFRQMKYEAERRKILEGVSTDRLEPAVGRIARDLHAAGYDNVWKVCQVEDINQFLKHGQAGMPEIGIRVNDLIRLRAYLEQQGLTVKWDA